MRIKISISGGGKAKDKEKAGEREREGRWREFTRELGATTFNITKPTNQIPEERVLQMERGYRVAKPNRGRRVTKRNNNTDHQQLVPRFQREVRLSQTKQEGGERGGGLWGIFKARGTKQSNLG